MPRAYAINSCADCRSEYMTRTRESAERTGKLRRIRCYRCQGKRSTMLLGFGVRAFSYATKHRGGLMLRSIPPMTSTGGSRLRSADPQRFRTRPREQPQHGDDPHGAGMASSAIDTTQYEKPECYKPLVCRTCGCANINGADEHDGEWYVYCVDCDSRQPALERGR